MSYLAMQSLRAMRAAGELDAVTADKFAHVIWANHAQWGAQPHLPPAMAARLEELRGAARLRAALAQHAVDGRVALAVTQMDCDCAQWTSTVTLPATPQAVNAYLDRLYADAEGPVSWHWITPQQAAEHVPVHRDLALEAYEDGHPHVVYC